MPRSKALSDQAVLKATARVLLTTGPARFTLADVARESGLSPATLLQRFGSKRGLVLAFAESAADDAMVPFERARSEGGTPLDVLRRALVSATAELRTRDEVKNSLAVLLDDLSDDALRDAAVRHASTTESAIRSLLEAAMADGELPRTDPGELALSIHAAWNGAIIQWALRGPGEFEPFLDRVLAPLLPKPTKRRPAAAAAKPKRHPSRRKP